LEQDIGQVRTNLPAQIPCVTLGSRRIPGGILRIERNEYEDKIYSCRKPDESNDFVEPP
jgi:hypothetical protein